MYYANVTFKNIIIKVCILLYISIYIILTKICEAFAAFFYFFNILLLYDSIC